MRRTSELSRPAVVGLGLAFEPPLDNLGDLICVTVNNGCGEILFGREMIVNAGALYAGVRGDLTKAEAAKPTKAHPLFGGVHDGNFNVFHRSPPAAIC